MPESPETTFDWGVNDQHARAPCARNDVTRSDLPKAYVYQGSAYAVPAPKPRPVYARTIGSRLSGAVHPHAVLSVDRPGRRCARLCLAGIGQVISDFGATSQWRAQ